MQQYRYSEEGIELTKRFEGLRLEAYQDSGGIWTVGYGHTGADVIAGKCVSGLEAESLLRADLRTAIDCVNMGTKTHLEQYEFDALVDFCFNVGRGNFNRSTLLQSVNRRQMESAAEQFLEWTHVKGQTNRGLQRRRSAERAMFKGTYRAGSLA